MSPQTERYQSNPKYREEQRERARKYRARQRSIRDADKQLCGWGRIGDAPLTEVLKVWDPAIFWPVYARYDNGHWVGIHYSGKINPTHFQHIEKLPRVR